MEYPLYHDQRPRGAILRFRVLALADASTSGCAFSLGGPSMNRCPSPTPGCSLTSAPDWRIHRTGRSKAISLAFAFLVFFSWQARAGDEVNDAKERAIAEVEKV